MFDELMERLGRSGDPRTLTILRGIKEVEQGLTLLQVMRFDADRIDRMENTLHEAKMDLLGREYRGEPA